jgi:hypothetical protein
LTDEQIRNIVFSETRSLNGKGVHEARLMMARSIMNADHRWGETRGKHAGTMDTVLPKHLSPYEQRLLKQVGGIVTLARTVEFAVGDPANGATNFHMKRIEDPRPPRNYGETFTEETHYGPLPDNLGGSKYIYIWQNPDAKRR